MSGKAVGYARKLDDLIIDGLLQPAVNFAGQQFGLKLHTLARLSTLLGAAVGLLWVAQYDAQYSADFWEDLLCLSVMAGAALLQIRTQEGNAPQRPAMAPAVRLTGLIWRTLWLAALVLFPTQWPLEPHGALLGNLVWIVLLILPYWIICCRAAPPRERRVAGILRFATIPVR